MRYLADSDEIKVISALIEKTTKGDTPIIICGQSGMDNVKIGSADWALSDGKAGNN